MKHYEYLIEYCANLYGDCAEWYHSGDELDEDFHALEREYQATERALAVALFYKV
jgi:hypothetical protein